MSAPIPKPVKRGPKPRRRIARRSAKNRRRRTPAAIRERKAQVRLADALASLLVRYREPYQCDRCGLTALPSSVDPHHLIVRSHHAVRWDLRNLARVHRRCHDALQRDKVENERVAIALLGFKGWIDLRVIGSFGRPERPADAIERLRAEVLARGLEREAHELGLL